MVQTINNKTLLEKAWPMVRQVRPSISNSVHVEIIGDLVPELPVQVLKLWSRGIMESMANFYAVSASTVDDAAYKFVAYCKTNTLRGHFINCDDYKLWTSVNPAIADSYMKLGGHYFETAYFKTNEFTLRDFVIEYCKVM